MSYTNQIQEFKNNDIWKTGYYEGNPLNPNEFPRSFIKKDQHLGYSPNSNKSWLHETYIHYIKPYINKDTNCLEIGPGRGGWTKCMIEANSIYTLDVAPPDKFNEYVGVKENIHYIVVNDFLCKKLPENYFDYMFSMGCLCHIPFDGVKEYAKNIFSKLKSGANCFWMVADENKFNLAMKTNKLFPRTYKENVIGCFYQHGIDNTCNMLQEVGYTIVNKDVNVMIRDPLIHFKKA